MPWLAAVVPAVAGLAGGIMQSGAQDRATQAQTTAAKNALGFAQNQWNTAQAQMAPYYQAGVAAIPEMQKVAMTAGQIDPTQASGYNPITTLTSPGQFQFNTTGSMADPSYAWRLNQGLDAVNASAAAKGGYFSGNTGKALLDYGQGAASQEYQNQFNRWNQMFSNYMNQEGFNANLYNQAFTRELTKNQNQYNQFAGIAGMGQNAANTTVGAGNQFATNAANTAMNEGNITATGATNQAKIWSNVLSNASNQFMSAWGQQQMLDQLAKNQFNPNALGPGY